MLIYEAVQLVHIFVHNDVQPLLDCVVLGDLLRCELLGHCGRVRRRGAAVIEVWLCKIRAVIMRSKGG